MHVSCCMSNQGVAVFCSPHTLFWGGNFPAAKCSCSKAWTAHSWMCWTRRVSCSSSLWVKSRITWTTCCLHTKAVWQQHQTLGLNPSAHRESGPTTLPGPPRRPRRHLRHPKAPPWRRHQSCLSGAHSRSSYSSLLLHWSLHPSRVRHAEVSLGCHRYCDWNARVLFQNHHCRIPLRADSCCSHCLELCLHPDDGALVSRKLEQLRVRLPQLHACGCCQRAQGHFLPSRQFQRRHPVLSLRLAHSIREMPVHVPQCAHPTPHPRSRGRHPKFQNSQ